MLCETPPAHTEIEHQHARDERHRRWRGRLPPPQEANRWRNEQQPATGSCNAGGQAGASKFFHLCRERSETHQWMETSRLTQQAIKHEGDDSGKRTQCSGNPGGQHDKEYKLFRMLAKEISFVYDMSRMPRRINSAIYNFGTQNPYPVTSAPARTSWKTTRSTCLSACSRKGFRMTLT